MTNYLIRRIFQMVLVILLAAVFVYFLFNISPGGPLAGIQQQQRRITREDLARLRANYELDLYWPIRFSRWLIGVPDRPDRGRRPGVVCQHAGGLLPAALRHVSAGSCSHASPAATITCIWPSCRSCIRRSGAAAASCVGILGYPP